MTRASASLNEFSIFRKLRFFIVYPFVVWLFVTARTTERSLRLGIVLLAVGQAIRFWANGYVGHRKVGTSCMGTPKVGHIVTAGPYAFTRNPLYLGSMIIGFGFCVIVNNLWLGFSMIAGFYLIYGRKIADEEAGLEKEWKKEFTVYRSAVPRWLPTWRRYPSRWGNWDWRGVAASKEWKTLVWVTATVIGLYFREEIFQEKESFFLPEELFKHVLLFVVFVILVMGDGLYEVLKHRRKQRDREMKETTVSSSVGRND